MTHIPTRLLAFFLGVATTVTALSTQAAGVPTTPGTFIASCEDDEDEFKEVFLPEMTIPGAPDHTLIVGLDCYNDISSSILGSVASEDEGHTVKVDMMGGVQGFSLTKDFHETTILDLNGDNGNKNGFGVGEWEQEH